MLFLSFFSIFNVPHFYVIVAMEKLSAVAGNAGTTSGKNERKETAFFRRTKIVRSLMCCMAA
jgi:hypothetical protein